MTAGRRALITGMGAVTPYGVGADALWAGLVEGRSAIGLLDGEEWEDQPVRIGGQVRGLDPLTVVPKALARRLSPSLIWALAAADEALAHVAAGGAAAPTQPTDDGDGDPTSRDGLGGPALPRGWDPARTSVIVGTGSGPVDAMQTATRALDASGPRGVPLTLPIYGAGDAAAALASQRYGIRGPAQAISATCASSALALGEAMRRIRHGYADAVLVIGVEDCLGPVNMAANATLRALAAGFEDRPEEASRPFDRSRSGFVMSAGAVALVVESADSAARRGAQPLAEIAGFGATSDAGHPTAPDAEGRGAAQAIADCLADAGAAPGAVDSISAHATGTPAGDAAELRALASSLGERAQSVPITAVKSGLGHLIGASGAAQALVAARSLQTGLIPPILNLTDPEDPDFDCVTGRARDWAGGSVLSTSFGFGGHNAALLLRRA